MIYMKSNEVKALRDKLLKENKGICPIMKVTLSEDEAVLDHIHASSRTGLGGDNEYGCVNTISRSKYNRG